MEDTQENKNDRKKDYEYLKEIFDKQIELEKMRQKKTPAWKIITLIFTGIASIAFLAFTCFMLYKQSLTMETLLAVLLSFFSIGLSIMFYIQSEKSSSAYYMRSYEIMKEVSVTLGKIEASFGEKLAHINSNIENISHKEEEKKNQIEEQEKEQKNLADKITKEKSEEQRATLVKELQEKTRETERLRIELKRLERMRDLDFRRNMENLEKVRNQQNIINGLVHDRNYRNWLVQRANEENPDIEE